MSKNMETSTFEIPVNIRGNISLKQAITFNVRLESHLRETVFKSDHTTEEEDNYLNVLLEYDFSGDDESYYNVSVEYAIVNNYRLHELRNAAVHYVRGYFDCFNVRG